MRTPLTSLKAAGQLLIRRAWQHSYAERDINLINTVIQQADRMTRLIEELLDVSQLQSGNLQLRPEIFDLSKLAAEVNEMSGLTHPGYRHSLVADEPVWVDADRDRIAQVLTNLLDNAIKYNKGEGLVEVTVEAIRSARIAEVRGAR